MSICISCKYACFRRTSVKLCYPYKVTCIHVHVSSGIIMFSFFISNEFLSMCIVRSKTLFYVFRVYTLMTGCRVSIPWYILGHWHALNLVYLLVIQNSSYLVLRNVQPFCCILIIYPSCCDNWYPIYVFVIKKKLWYSEVPKNNTNNKAQIYIIYNKY